MGYPSRVISDNLNTTRDAPEYLPYGLQLDLSIHNLILPHGITGLITDKKFKMANGTLGGFIVDESDHKYPCQRVCMSM